MITCLVGVQVWPPTSQMAGFFGSTAVTWMPPEWVAGPAPCRVTLQTPVPRLATVSAMPVELYVATTPVGASCTYAYFRPPGSTPVLDVNITVNGTNAGTPPFL